MQIQLTNVTELRKYYNYRMEATVDGVPVGAVRVRYLGGQVLNIGFTNDDFYLDGSDQWDEFAAAVKAAIDKPKENHYG